MAANANAAEATLLAPSDAGRLVSFDIETRPTVEGGSALKPAESEIYMVSFFGTTGAELIVIDEEGVANERELLETTFRYIEGLAADAVLVGWNTGGFDLPFLDYRYQAHAGLEGQRPDIFDTGRRSKYNTPVYDGSWQGRRHVDICDLYRGVAEELDVKWSLKPVATALGLEPVVLDASVLTTYTAAEQRAYSLSDARCVFQLATLAAVIGPEAVARHYADIR